MKSLGMDSQHINHIPFKLNLQTGLLEGFPINQENVLDAFAQCHDFRCMQVDPVTAENPCNRIQRKS